ncbi:hypothetical protein AB0C52_14535 [Streptomyces sp. NPDC048717]|uniref:hypothetical protein n=1 Tax=Streptomyces sp. NPDC048717 TaxID=3154928 RepID=UPI00343EAA2B
MTHLPKGANTPVPTVTLRVAAGRLQVPGGPTEEVAAFCDDGVFGQVPGLYAQAVTADGTVVARLDG